MKFTERNWKILGVVRGERAGSHPGRDYAGRGGLAAWRELDDSGRQARRTTPVESQGARRRVHRRAARATRRSQRSAWAFPYPLFVKGANARLFGGKAVTGWSDQAQRTYLTSATGGPEAKIRGPCLPHQGQPAHLNKVSVEPAAAHSTVSTPASRQTTNDSITHVRKYPTGASQLPQSEISSDE